MKNSEKIWWMKVASALVMGGVCLSLQVLVGIQGIYAFFLGTAIYMGLSDLLATTMKVERQRSLKIGIGAFIFTWLTTWTFLYTLIQVV
ncbi:MAG: hypothetical protein ACLFVP_00450 [Candidatus Bathyarchaeia archaeon]